MTSLLLSFRSIKICFWLSGRVVSKSHLSTTYFIVFGWCLSPWLILIFWIVEIIHWSIRLLDRRGEDVGMEGFNMFYFSLLNKSTCVFLGHFHSYSVLNYHYFFLPERLILFLAVLSLCKLTFPEDFVTFFNI